MGLFSKAKGSCLNRKQLYATRMYNMYVRMRVYEHKRSLLHIKISYVWFIVLSYIEEMNYTYHIKGRERDMERQRERVKKGGHKNIFDICRHVESI